MPTGTKTSKGNVAYLTEEGELIVPVTAPKRFQYARGGWSVWQILAELDAPLKAWERYAYAENLAPANHSRFCKGAVSQGDGFVYCVECGRYQKQ
jgi:hypothetical protein